MINLRKNIYKNPTANSKLHGETPHTVSWSSETRQNMSTLMTLIQYCTASLSQWIRQEKEIKCTQIVKEEIKLFLFVDDMIVYIRKSQIENKKPPGTNNYIKAAGYKVNT